MNIVQIIPQLASGGAERLVVDLSNELSKNNNVTLISFFAEDKYNFYNKELFQSVKHIVIGKQPGFSLKMFFHLGKLLNSLRPDVVHLHLAAINYIVPYLLMNRATKCFMTIHNDAFEEAEGNTGLKIRNFCFKNNLIRPITISKESKRSFIDCYKMDAPVILNGRMMPSLLTVSDSVHCEFIKYRKTPKTKVLVNLARFSVVKRQPLIAKCVKRLYDEGFDFAFLMIGQTRAADVLAGVEEYKCPALHVLGEKHNPLEYLKLADAYCLFSTHEGLPISLIEALATSTVPVCTPVGGIIDVVENGVNGLLSKDLSEDAVYNTMKEFLLLDESSLSSLKDNALKSFGKYSIEETAKQYLSLFKS